ncbi:MAG: hypothetical protein U0228_38340 [Myxococcaceae bacterium]
MRAASELQGRLWAELESGDALWVDGGAVTTCDTAAAQLFVALSREARVRWTLSAPLRAKLDQLALPVQLFKEGSPS